MKRYGIYLAYPPGINLEAQGLGRHLIAFLDEARSCENAQFAIACPSWLRAQLLQLLEDSGISPSTFELIGPEKKPLLLSIYESYRKRKRRGRWRSSLLRLLSSVVLRGSGSITMLEQAVVTSRNPLLLAILAAPIAIGLLIAITLYIVFRLISPSRRLTLKIRRRLFYVASPILRSPQDSGTIFRLYRLMEEAEAEVMRGHINARKDIVAWYSPTAFWPHFNLINAPRLTCLPDVVLSDFPVAFSAINGNRFLDVFRSIELAINGGDHFVTYSNDIKDRTLVGRYHVDPASITVVPHGAARLNELVTVSGFPDNDGATNALCRNLIQNALHKAIGLPHGAQFNPREAKFLFYASQFRPNKNVLSLLRAYEFLLKRRFISHKLILTGNPHVLPEIARFIREHNLRGDVVCLYGLSERELAACYRLADLAVNPTLSEGGCPFTLTEALSVGTPVVMGRIAVTEEVVTDPELQELMLFDPYDWEDMAARIEWALQNKESLLERQLQLYDKLAARSWKTVVDEYVAILDQISTPAPSTERA